MTSILMALDSIREKKGRSFLTMLGIIIGVTAVLVLVALVSGYNADITAYYEKMGVNKVEISLSWYDIARGDDYTDALHDFADEYLDGMVTGVSPELSTTATVSYGGDMTSDTELVLTNEDYDACGNYTIETGRTLSIYDMDARSYVCVLGSYVADTLFQYSDPIGQTVLINGSSYTVVGTYYQKDGGTEGSMDDIVIVPYTLSRTLMGIAYPTEFIIKVSSSSYMTSAMTVAEYWLATELSSTVVSYTVTNGNDAMDAATEEMTSMSLVLGGVAGIALLVGGIGIMNIMLVTVSERTREIGIKKAIGAPNGDIIVQFLVEAAILSAMGGLIGVGLGYVLSAVLGRLMYDLITLPSTIVTIGAFSFAVAIGVLFGLYPAAKAANLQPVDALRVD